MGRTRIRHPLRYRRARSLLFAIILFWSWLVLGSDVLLRALHGAPLHAALIVWGLCVVILVSIPAALLAGMRMVELHPRRTGVLVRLPAPPAQRPRADPERWSATRAS